MGIFEHGEAADDHDGDAAGRLLKCQYLCHGHFSFRCLVLIRHRVRTPASAVQRVKVVAVADGNSGALEHVDALVVTRDAISQGEEETISYRFGVADVYCPTC